MTQKLVVDCSVGTEASEPTYMDLTPEEEEQRGIDADAGKAVAWIQLRASRLALLAASDWAVMPDAPLSERKKKEWLTYRQALRDLPANTRNPETVVWPSPPN